MKIYRFIRNALAVIGGLIAYLASSTDYYYTEVLFESVPGYVGTAYKLGFMFMIPFAIHLLHLAWKELKYELLY